MKNTFAPKIIAYILIASMTLSAPMTAFADDGGQTPTLENLQEAVEQAKDDLAEAKSDLAEAESEYKDAKKEADAALKEIKDVIKTETKENNKEIKDTAKEISTLEKQEDRLNTQEENLDASLQTSEGVVQTAEQLLTESEEAIGRDILADPTQPAMTEKEAEKALKAAEKAEEKAKKNYESAQKALDKATIEEEKALLKAQEAAVFYNEALAIYEAAATAYNEAVQAQKDEEEFRATLQAFADAEILLNQRTEVKQSAEIEYIAAVTARENCQDELATEEANLIAYENAVPLYEEQLRLAREQEEETSEQYEQAKNTYDSQAIATEGKQEITDAKEEAMDDAADAAGGALAAWINASEALADADEAKQEKFALKELAKQSKTDAETELSEADGQVTSLRVLLKQAEDLAAAKKAIVDLGSLGFFQSWTDSNSAQMAAALLQGNVEEWMIGANNWESKMGFTNIGAENDATNLENMKVVFDFIREGNALRTAGDNNFAPMNALYVNSLLMAMAQAQANCSATRVFESIGHSFMFQNGEILAYGYYDPYDGWYYEEKETYEATNGTGGNIGHYKAIMNSEKVATGFAMCIRDDDIFADYSIHNQVFNNTAYEQRYGDSYDLDTYEAKFYEYYDAVMGAMNEANEAVAAAKANLDAAETRKANAQAALKDAQEALEEAEAVYEAAVSAYEDALAADAAAEETYDALYQEYEVAKEAYEEAADDLAQAQAVLEENEAAMNDAKDAHDEAVRIAEEKDAELSGLLEIIEDTKENIEVLKKTLSDCQKVEEAKKAAYDKASKRYNDAKAEYDRLNEISETLPDPDTMRHVTKDELKSLKKAMDKAEKEMKAAEKKKLKAETAYEKALKKASNAAIKAGEKNGIYVAKVAAANEARTNRALVVNGYVDDATKEKNLASAQNAMNTSVTVTASLESKKDSTNGLLDTVVHVLSDANDRLAAAKDKQEGLKLLNISGIITGTALYRASTEHIRTLGQKTQAALEKRVERTEKRDNAKVELNRKKVDLDNAKTKLGKAKKGNFTWQPKASHPAVVTPAVPAPVVAGAVSTVIYQWKENKYRMDGKDYLTYFYLEGVSAGDEIVVHLWNGKKWVESATAVSGNGCIAIRNSECKSLKHIQVAVM